MYTFSYIYAVTISFKTQWQFIENTSQMFSYFLSGKRNGWFDIANNKFDQKVNLNYFGRKLYNKQRFLEITQSSLQRKRKRSAKPLDENQVPLYDEVSDVKTFYRRIYFDAIDTVTNCIKIWFWQPGYRAVKNIEQLILNVINELEYQNQLEDVLSDYGEEIKLVVCQYNSRF